jgi:hypothetical protein
MLINTLSDILMSGCQMRTTEQVTKRLRTCRDCAHSKQETGAICCTKCGCNMNIKAQFSASKCPISEAW